jgi:hypothetical protein
LLWRKGRSILVPNKEWVFEGARNKNAICSFCSKYHIHADISGKTRLTISELGQLDEGTYSCEGINDYGRAITESRLTTDAGG